MVRRSPNGCSRRYCHDPIRMREKEDLNAQKRVCVIIKYTITPERGKKCQILPRFKNANSNLSPSF